MFLCCFILMSNNLKPLRYLGTSPSVFGQPKLHRCFFSYKNVKNRSLKKIIRISYSTWLAYTHANISYRKPTVSRGKTMKIHLRLRGP